MESRRGFTLLELMIVIAVILIIAAIAIPGMKDAKMNADETSAVGSIRVINTAEVSYQAAYGGYANALSNLGGEEPCTRSAETACLIDQSLAGGDKSGYKFMVPGGNPSGEWNTTYVVGAAPDVFDHTGRRMFCSTEKGVIRVNANTSGSTTPPDAQQCMGFTALK